MESESNAALAGEMWNGAGRGAQNAVYVYYDADGAVVSFCFDGRVYHGIGGHAGQTAGYLFAEDSPGECRMTPAWWLPTVRLSRAERRQLAEAGIGNPPESFAELIAAVGGDAAGAPDEVLRRRLDMLAHGLMNICNLLSPERIILGGSLADMDDAMLEYTRGRLAEAAVRHIPVGPTSVVRGELPLIKAIFAGGASSIFRSFVARVTP